MISVAARRASAAGVLTLLGALVPAVTVGGGSAGAAPAAAPAAPVVNASGASVVDTPTRLFSRLGTALHRQAGQKVPTRPSHYATAKLDGVTARRALTQAPTATQQAQGAAPLRITLPAPDGSTRTFAVVSDPVMEPGLAAQHPEISTYAGRDVADPTRTVRLDLTPLGLHASVRGPGGQGSWYVDPAFVGRGVTQAISYYGAAMPADPTAFREPVDSALVADSVVPGADAAAARTAAGAEVMRRTYRLALLSDPTYAKYFGTANVAAAKVTLINRVDQVYNDDLAIKFVLIDGTDKLNLDTAAKATGAPGPCGASACYTSDEISSCSGSTLTRNDFVLGQLVGADTFDIGHIALGTNGGGIAGLGVVGGSTKGEGCTGIPTPKGDFYAVDYVAHEMGHEMGGDHPFNGTQTNCSAGNRNASTSVEPGSGTSVMAYAGICQQDNLQPHSDPYFSQRSIDEITTTTSATPGTENEVQQVTLSGFDASGDSFQLTYPGATPVTINYGTTSGYTALQVSQAIFTLTGCRNTLSAYDSASPILSTDGFQITFNLAACAGTDLPRIGVGTTTGGVTGFVGVLTNGGDDTNQGVVDATGDHAPKVTAPADKTIPIRTPFTLTGSGTDVDGDPLTYLWEQNDVGGTNGTALVSNTKTDGPLFRIFGTYADVTDEGTLLSPSPGENIADASGRSRTFPDLDQILANNTNAETGTCPAAPSDVTLPVPRATVDCFSEFLPTADYGNALTGATLDFRLTARDLFPTGGGTQYDDVALTVDSSAGPFLVTSRKTAGTPAPSGGQEAVTWDVAGTDSATFATNVRITLSLDGGHTYPFVLAKSTPNDGSQTVTLPKVNTSNARIGVSAVGNYFFDVNDADFTIGSGTPPAKVDTLITGGPKPGSFLLGSSTKVSYRSPGNADATFACKLDGRKIDCGTSSVTLKNLEPGMHALSVTAKAGGVSDKTPNVRRFSVVYDDTALSKTTKGWKRQKVGGTYHGSYLTATAKGQTLAYQLKGVNRVALLIARGKGLGDLKITIGGETLGTIHEQASSTKRQVLYVFRDFTRKVSGAMKITSTSGKTVHVDGFGLFTKP